VALKPANLDPLGVAIVSTLEAFWGERFKFNAKHIPVWNAQLEHLDVNGEEAVAAIRKLVRHHTHGAPYLAEVVREILLAREAADFIAAETRAKNQLATTKPPTKR